MASELFSRNAIERRLGIQDPRGPQGMFARGANVYRGGLPQAQMGGGNPNIGRPSMQPISNGQEQLSPSLTSMVGSLPPNAGSSDQNMNNAVLDLIRRRYNMQGT